MSLVTRLSGSDSLALKGLMVGLATLGLIIPVEMVRGVIAERHARHLEVIDALSTSWGGEQVIVGPLLVVPFIERWQDSEVVPTTTGSRQISVPRQRSRELVVLPASLDAKLDLDVETRRRGIYSTVVYRGEVALDGVFGRIDWTRHGPNAIEPDYRRARLVIGIADPKAVQSLDWLTTPGVLATEPSTGLATLANGLQARLTGGAAIADGAPFSARIGLNGSRSVALAPVAASNTIAIAGNWPHPAFEGLLPGSREVEADGFTAQWRVQNLVRSYPQTFVSDATTVAWNESLGTVRLLEPVGLYTQTDRAAKYAVLFTALTFAAFLIFELTAVARPHLVQYVLIGGAIALFYLLLLALAEHIGFGLAYLVAAAAIATLIGWYAAFALGGARRGITVGASIAVTYAVLYVILSLEDFALLTGATMLFVALAALMFFTRNLRFSEPAAPGIATPPADPLAARQPV